MPVPKLRKTDERAAVTIAPAVIGVHLRYRTEISSVALVESEGRSSYAGAVIGSSISAKPKKRQDEHNYYN
jgi:hypothetical protein